MNLAVLDDPGERARLDPGGMLAAVEALPEQCEEAWAAARALRLPAEFNEIDRIVVLGMGGSAIAGDLWRVLLERECSLPVFNIRDYTLPPFVDGRTIVIASSFSGNTEETLMAFREALGTGARKLALTTGGRLLELARANGVPAFTYQFAGEPRAAIGWSLMPLLAVGRELGLMQGIDRDVEEMTRVLREVRAEIGIGVPASGSPAKQLAGRLHQALPVIYGSGPLVEVARRWKTQLNESSKVWAFHEQLPEIHHNAIIGYRLPHAIAQATSVVFLQSSSLVHPRVQLRYQFTRKLLKDAGIAFSEVEARGSSALAQIMSLVLFGDYVSGYLAFLYGVDPTPTIVIDELKAWLAQQP